MIQSYEVDTTQGEIVVFIKEVKDNNYTLRSDAFYADYLLVKGCDEKTKNNFIELRSNIGFILLNVFENLDGTYEPIKIITNWIIENNN